jgi:small subunit ribosomal protein S21e
METEKKERSSHGIKRRKQLTTGKNFITTTPNKLNLFLHTTMQNDQGEIMDLYIPRKCSWTNRVLGSNDFGSVQFNVGHVDPKTGIYTGDFTPIALSGVVRKRGEADMAVNELVGKMGNKWPLAQ